MKDPFGVVFIIIGLAFTVAGIAFSIAALVKDLREYGSGPVWPWAARIGGWVLRPFRRRRVDLLSTTHNVAASVRGSGSMTVGPTVASPDASLEERIEVLTTRVEEIETRSEAERRRLTETNMALCGELHDLGRQRSAATAKVEAMTRSVAIGTAKLQLWGLFFVAAGTLMMAIPALVDAFAG